MKRAQLKGLRIPGTLLLADECQDMDGCQIDWIEGQRKFGTDIYFVGDAAQTISSFRGAKCRYLLSLPPPVTERYLTKSWRFGQGIADIANAVLFVKEKSPQTTDNYYKVWTPYRVTGGSNTPCMATLNALFQTCYSEGEQITIIARTNVRLLVEVIKLLGFIEPEEESEGADEAFLSEEIPVVTQESETQAGETQDMHLPKIHVNGKGETSGMKTWKKVISEIESLYELYIRRGEMSLPRKQFPELKGRKMSWNSFCKEVEDRELNNYIASRMVVARFKKKTLQVVALFVHEVIEKAYSAEEADVILSTGHAAKGLEWDNVQVCEDFTDWITKVEECSKPAVHQNIGASPKKKGAQPKYQFAAKNFGDDLNLLYVACTRAKKKLCLPPSFEILFGDCDILHNHMQAKRRESKQEFFLPRRRKKDAGGEKLNVLGVNGFLGEEEIKLLYHDICQPLREQYGIAETETLMESLLGRFPENDYISESEDDVIISSQ